MFRHLGWQEIEEWLLRCSVEDMASKILKQVILQSFLRTSVTYPRLDFCHLTKRIHLPTFQNNFAVMWGKIVEDRGRNEVA